MMREVQRKALVKNWDNQNKPKASTSLKEEIKEEMPKPQGDSIHVVFARGIRWKGNHVGAGTELDVSVGDAKELLMSNAIKDVKLPSSEQPLHAFKIPSTKQLRRSNVL
jgi:hypothetical protein